ncbi:thiamine pyrophosphate-requiring protein [Phytohabitans flavus]|uniref:Acetolactate synthase n=1 Tax=Phytohabitans flavus TaxID=1076124 RepID=A0A6F8XVQ6_9ACTN|nr:thiamine pyrophosphate-requiring protein [Phytohabitans flavus]BCB77900.1 acetolactate synthase [Phytohabitans flavus]
MAGVSTAEVYLRHLRRRGVDRLFVNAGTDFATLVELYSRYDKPDPGLPDVVVCAHENLAVSMAHGAYLATGRAQAVMVHTSVGTANAVCGLFSASRARVPVLLTAGRTPLFEDGALGARNAGIHWGQELYDQAGMVRELVKWDYELRDPVHVSDVVDRALDIALAEPRGPVYLTLPREVLARPADTLPADARALSLPTPPAPHPAAVALLADRLAAARYPVIVTSGTGADVATVPLLADLCDRFHIGVAEREPRYVNVPADHPLHLGHDVADADLLCFLDVDVPWIPRTGRPGDGTFVAQCGPDPLFTGYPIRGHRADLSVTASPRALLEALGEALEERRDRVDATRRAPLAAAAAARRERIAARLEASTSASGPIDKTFLNLALREVRDPSTVVVDEYWCSPELLGATEPGTYYGSPPAGALGWGLPAALGVQLASPDRTVVATVGDGAYMFANPAACHHAMARHGLPVLVVVATNSVWGAVDGSTLGMYPKGELAARGGPSVFAQLDPIPEFERYAEASGGLGLVVHERHELVPALRTALQVVREERRHALVNVLCA